MTTYAITSPVADLPFQMKQTFAGESVFVKNAYVAYLLTSSGFTLITDTDYPSYHSYAVTSITRVGSVATVTTTTTNTLETGNTVVISGAVETEYNGTFTITGITTPGTVFTYTVTGTPATPATGTITAYGGWTTVPGIVYLDDYIFVGRTDGEIQNCNRGAFTIFDALDFFTPDKEPSLLVRIAKSLNFLVAFKTWDTQFYYNADVAPPGSPMLEQESAYLKLGCASAYSVVEFDGGIVFMSQRDQNQRSREIHLLNGLTPQKLSDAYVERLLNADDLATVYSLYLSTAGHQFYVLTLVTSGITIVYDFANKSWAQWSSLSAQSAQSVISLTRDGYTVTASVEDHGFSDGDPVTMAGATETEYNGTFNIRYVDDNTFTYQIPDAPDSPATGTITAMGYDESYLDAVAYATVENLDVTLAEATGVISALDRDIYQDTDVPIDVKLRTALFDYGSDNETIITYARPIGDRVAGKLLVRYTDNDYNDFSRYRPANLDVARPQISGLGSTKRRAYDVRYTEDTELRIEALEIESTKGYT